MKKILIIGYGSIGKRHASNLINLGYSPFVLTSYPDDRTNVTFISIINEIQNPDYVIIATPTANHYVDLLKAIDSGCKNILIEKPIESNLSNSEKILDIVKKKGISVYIAYNLRYLKIFDVVKDIIKNQLTKIRLVKIVAGQYLPEWRTGIDYRASYSSRRIKGGGVDLDLSHELDYMLWLFGYPESIEYIKREKISSLEIDSPDYFNGIYKYNNFIANVELDYIRKKERSLRIIGENDEILFIDFIKKIFFINGQNKNGINYFDSEKSYIDEMQDFLENNNKNNLSSLSDGINVLKLLQLG